MREKNIFCVAVVLFFFFGCKKDSAKDTIIPVIQTPFAPPSSTSPADFKGVNWADERDNFADDELVLSGINAMDNYSTVQSKSAGILAAFQNAGVNTVRLPVNPSTVMGNRWQPYKGSIDKALDLGMKVVLAYWEGNTSKDGLVDNTYTYWRMWDSVITNYKSNGNIYFEPFNEPHGYNLTDLGSLYATFLSRYPGLPRGRVILDGAGYATDVNGVGKDSRFDSCFLSFHYYTWFDNKQTSADWEQPIRSLTYPSRTIVTEFGVPMTGSKDYLSAPGSDIEVTYLQGMTNAIHDLHTGAIYWPGLRTNDSYSMFTITGAGIEPVNATGLSRLKFAWHNEDIEQPAAHLIAGAPYKVINKFSGKSMDVTNNSVEDGASIIQWDYQGSNDQQWLLQSLSNGYYSVHNKNSSKALDIIGSSNDAGKDIIQLSTSGSSSQQWQLIDIGFGYYKFINVKSGLALDVSGMSAENGGKIIQWHWNSGANQQWQITGL